MTAREAWTWATAAGLAGVIVVVGFSGAASTLGLRADPRHVAAGGRVVVVVARALEGRRALPGWRRALAALCICTALGALDELAQTWAPLRTADFLDLAADVVGAALGVGAASTLQARRSRRTAT